MKQSQYISNFIGFQLWLYQTKKKKNKDEACLFEIEPEDLNAHFQTLYHSFIFNLSFSSVVISFQVITMSES